MTGMWRLAVPAMLAGALLAGGAQAQNAAKPINPVTIKLYTSDIVVAADGLEVDTVHLEQQANNAAAAQSMGQFSVPYSDTMQDLDIQEAYTRKADGRKIPVAPAAIFNRLPQGASQEPMFDDQRQKTVVFPDVEAGDTVVITYVAHGKQAYLPGQFFTHVFFGRATTYDDAHGSITAPKAMKLNVEAHDIGLEKSDDATTSTWRWHYAAPGQVQPDTAVISAHDRSPRLLISSFKTYDDFVRAYAPLMTPKMAASDAITTLSAQIAAGVSDRRKKAELLYDWVSQHIRYVGIELGVGGIIPHDAAQILSNRYGDCKDHVVLFAALLKAQGIDSQLVMINYGNAYTLPDTPGIGELNHAITYIPEFKLYADTTAAIAPFGVLPFGEYGKPVIHVATDGPALRHVPVLAPGSASVAYTTHVQLDAKANFTGTTKTVATGPFAIMLRQFGQALQAGGADRLAAGYLQQMGLPGTASFVTAPPTPEGSDYTMDSSYTLGPFPALLTGEVFNMPAHFEMLGYPGDGLAGPLSNRTVRDSDPTPCFSGHASEDIAVEPPPGQSFRAPPKDSGFDTAHVHFKSHWSLSGQTVTLHRDVTTHFDTSLCSGAVRTETAKALGDIRTAMEDAISLAPPVSAANKDLADDTAAAQAAYAQGDYARAASLTSAMLASPALPPEMRWRALLARALADRAMQKNAEALADLTAALALNDKDESLYRYRAGTYVALKDWDRAIADASQAIAMQPADSDALTSRANADYGKGDFDRSIADESQVLALLPGNVVALRNRALAYGAKGDADKAIADFSAVIQEHPDQAQGYRDLGLAEYGKGQYAQAVADLSKAIAMQPGDPVALTGRGEVYQMQRDYDHAIADDNAALALNAAYAPAMRDRGVAYEYKGDLDRALADLQAAIALDAHDPRSLAARADIYSHRRDYDQALAGYDAALQLAPGNPYSLNGACWDHAMQGRDLDLALAQCNMALAASRTNGAVLLDSRGFVYFRMGKFDLAKADYDAAIAAGPLGVTYYKRGLVKEKLGDMAGGKADIAAGLAMDKHAGDDMTAIGLLPAA